jgi:hypothetical protein
MTTVELDAGDYHYAEGGGHTVHRARPAEFLAATVPFLTRIRTESARAGLTQGTQEHGRDNQAGAGHRPAATT